MTAGICEKFIECETKKTRNFAPEIEIVDCVNALIRQCGNLFECVNTLVQ